MDPSIIILFVILFLLSAFFSGTEIALMSLPSHKIESLLKKWSFGSKELKYIKERNDKLLITILIGNNLVNVYTAALATQISISIAENSWFEQSLAIGISTWIVTFLLLMFGEIAPKSFATKNSERIALLVAKPYKFLIILLHPLLVIIEIIIKVFTGKNTVQEMTDEEIEAFIDMGKSSGILEDKEHEKLKNMLDFHDIYVEEIMTPRVKMDALSSKSTLEEAQKFYLEHTHSRILVYEETIDKIDYIVTIRDILAEIGKWNKEKNLNDITLHKVIKVPLNQPISSLLEIFKKSHKHLALVIDEYGWVAWLITLEDIIEEVFGEIRDETDKEIDEIKEIWINKYEIDPHILMEDILDNFEINLQNIWLEEARYEWETVSYVITDKIGRFPENNEVIVFDIILDDSSEIKKSLEFKILGIVDGKIDRIEVSIKEKNL